MAITTLVILGANGDLTTRLLLPGLASLLAGEERRIRLVGVGQRDVPEWPRHAERVLADAGLDPALRERLVEDISYHQVDVTDEQGWPQFVTDLPEDAVLYFALPPAVTMRACELLEPGMLPEGSRLVLEKPFGGDVESARGFNRLLRRLLPEERIHRVDHFLGSSMVLNLLGVRFANRIIEPLWNGQEIESVDIVWDETLALEGRAGYYDGAGALVDMIQSHLLLVLALATMEAPSRIDAVELHDLMAHVLRATYLYGAPAEASRRARYIAGEIGGRSVPDYLAEEDVPEDSDTETLAEIAVEIRNRRWAGVPFRLRSGKALGDDRMSIRVRFKPVAHLPGGLEGIGRRNEIEFGLDPRNMRLRLLTNGAGDVRTMETTDLVAELGPERLTPYGEVLAGILDGDPLLSVRGDVAEECWRIVDGVLAAWRAGNVPMEEYPAGSGGPTGW